MAFQKTSASSQDDVIQQFIIFAVANAGFSDAGTVTVPGNVTSGFSNGRTMYRCSKGALTWGFSRTRGGNNQLPDFGFFIQMSLSPTINRPEGDVVNTPFRPDRCSCWNFAGPYANVYMFTDGVVVHCCIELASGIFTHFCIGSITKTEAFTGGEFMASMSGLQLLGVPPNQLYANWDSTFMHPMFPGVSPGNTPSNGNRHHNASFFNHIRAIPVSGDVTGFNRFATFSRAVNNNCAAGESMNGLNEHWAHKSYSSSSGIQVNSQNQRTPLWPNIIRLDHQTNNLWRLSGHIPSMRFCYIDYLNPGDIVLNDWQVFPYSQKDGDSTQCPNSGGYGIAYKRA